MIQQPSAGTAATRPCAPKETNAPASIAEDSANEDSFVRAEMVNDIAPQDVRHSLDRALRVVGVVVS